MEDKAADETDTNWRGNYSDDITEKLTGGSAASRRFLVQISAQNLGQILNVCIKVCTKQTQKGAYLQGNPFCDKSAYSQQNPDRVKSAYLTNCSLDM